MPPTQQQTNQIKRHSNLSLLFGGLAIIAGIAGAAFTGGTSLGLAAMGVSMAAGAYSSYETIRTGQVMKQAGISGGKTQQILGGVGIALSALPGVGAVLGTGARIAGASAAGASMISRAANTVATGVGAGMAGYGAVMTTKSIVDLASGRTQGTWQDYVGIIEGIAGMGVGAKTAYRGNGVRGSFTGVEEPLLQARPGVAETMEPPLLKATPGVEEKAKPILKQTTITENRPEIETGYIPKMSKLKVPMQPDMISSKQSAKGAAQPQRQRTTTTRLKFDDSKNQTTTTKLTHYSTERIGSRVRFGEQIKQKNDWEQWRSNETKQGRMPHKLEEKSPKTLTEEIAESFPYYKEERLIDAQLAAERAAEQSAIAVAPVGVAPQMA